MLQHISQINTPQEYGSAVLSGLTKRRSSTRGLDIKDGFTTIDTIVPLKDMFGYSSEVRYVMIIF